MEIRQATADDGSAIRSVADRSLGTSYDFLGEATIDDAVEQWYDEDALEATLLDGDQVFLVAERDGEVVAFSQSAVLGGKDGIGEIRWLHVDPDHRGHGIGVDLLERTQEVLRARGIAVFRGVVLEGNEAGAEFYEGHGFERTHDRDVEIGDETYTELTFELGTPGADETGDTVQRREADDRLLYVFRDRGDRGSIGRFYPAYTDPDGEELYGWQCGACGSFDNAMDAMGRMECNDCNNVRKPTRWDAAYL